MIYLDNAATTQCLDGVVDVMNNYLKHDYFNASSVYAPAVKVRRDVENARNELLDMVFASNHKLLFVSCATEANNTIFESATLRSGDKIIVSAGEHPSVFECAKQFQNNGVEVCVVDLLPSGEIDEEDFARKMDRRVKLVSVMMVSNETGAVNNIKRICKIAKKVNPRVLVATDGVQAFGKIDVCVDDLGVDFFVMSAHKIHGPKGIGALVYRKDIHISPLLWGGGQENGLRSGTENVAGIMGFFEAAKLSMKNQKSNFEKVQKIRDEFIDEFQNSGVKFSVNGNGSPFILSLSFDGIRGEVLLHALEEHEILVSTGSACSSKHSDNRILSAMGKSQAEVLGNVRISFNAHDAYDVKNIVKIFASTIEKLKG
ncbi:MAG: cysteine desulfurase [Clostridia bacterium]|nr:cysteine desulfurase [Clostridia bacterium]